MKDKPEKYPEILSDLADQVGQKLVDSDIGVERAAGIGWEVAEHVREHWRGQPIYIPKGDDYERSLRDSEIYSKFRGCNYAELAQAYNLSVVRIYQIVKTVTAEMIRKRQGALF